jgi:hypothetical protein
MKRVLVILGIVALFCFLASCAEEAESADRTQREKQEQIQQEGVAEVGMPAISSFFEAKELKRIYELRDHGVDGTGPMHTYTYAENMVPTIVHGHTVMGGKFTFMFDSVGFGFPYATQFSSPQKLERVYNTEHYYFVMPQCEPNLLFPPSSAMGTWVLVQDPTGKTKDLLPIYCEPNVLVVPFKLPFD